MGQQMDNMLLVFAAAALVNNFVLTQFLGLCPLFGASSQIRSALGMSLATTFVLTFSSILSFLVYHWLLVPFDLRHLGIITFIIVIALFVQAAEALIRASAPLLHQQLGLYLPLITTNCAVLAAMLFNVREEMSLFQSVTYSFGTAAGFSLVLISFAAIRERIADSVVPAPFQGASILMITAGLMSLAMIGFQALVVGEFS